MKFDTNSKLCSFNFGNKELSLLLYKIVEIESKEYGSFDPSLMIFRNILEVLLSLNEIKAIEFIESIENDVEFEIISNSFADMSRIFQSKNFIEKMENISKKHISSADYKIILDNINEAKNTFNEGGG
jgi:hypothetical protein